ncbi:unnamed protein product [Nezara viridula]|uniref:Uncharacterized protein n=1 Tax=Nezara viridula TaxID=85310 RepID=A0A9P0E595_NEZVI|nr:unnamed protein product [Nezara viridula]
MVKNYWLRRGIRLRPWGSWEGYSPANLVAEMSYCLLGSRDDNFGTHLHDLPLMLTGYLQLIPMPITSHPYPLERREKKGLSTRLAGCLHV